MAKSEASKRGAKGKRGEAPMNGENGTDMQVAALVYDFDGTLAKGNLPEHGLFPELGINTEHERKTFWDENKRRAKQHKSDEVLSYMKAILERAEKRGVKLTREYLVQHGRKVPFFKGVEEWFERINGFAEVDGFRLQHYVISSGLLELIEGTAVYSRFEFVFASAYEYDESRCPVWPAVGVNYTTKTQFLFRINKGILNVHDNDEINKWQPKEERPVPFSRMIFIGDGDTDIPSMKMVRYQGGQAVAVFDPDEFKNPRKQEAMRRLIAEDRVDYVAPADYSPGSQLEITVRGILGRIKTKGEARRRYIE